MVRSKDVAMEQICGAWWQRLTRHVFMLCTGIRQRMGHIDCCVTIDDHFSTSAKKLVNFGPGDLVAHLHGW